MFNIAKFGSQSWVGDYILHKSNIFLTVEESNQKIINDMFNKNLATHCLPVYETKYLMSDFNSSMVCRKDHLMWCQEPI